MTLRHRLLCTIQTDHEVKTSSTELCPVSPSYDSPAKFDLGKLRIPDSSECVPSMLVCDLLHVHYTMIGDFHTKCFISTLESFVYGVHCTSPPAPTPSLHQIYFFKLSLD